MAEGELSLSLSIFLSPLSLRRRQDFRMQIERYESSPLVPWGQNLLRWLWTVDGMPGPSRVYVPTLSQLCLASRRLYTVPCSARSGVTVPAESPEQKEARPSGREGGGTKWSYVSTIFHINYKGEQR